MFVYPYSSVKANEVSKWNSDHKSFNSTNSDTLCPQDRLSLQAKTKHQQLNEEDVVTTTTKITTTLTAVNTQSCRTEENCILKSEQCEKSANSDVKKSSNNIKQQQQQQQQRDIVRLTNSLPRCCSRSLSGGGFETKTNSNVQIVIDTSTIVVGEKEGVAKGGTTTTTTTAVVDNMVSRDDHMHSGSMNETNNMTDNIVTIDRHTRLLARGYHI